MSEKRGRLLVVDDEPMIHVVLQSMLEEHTESISVAHNGVEGLAMIEQGNFDAVISDISMPQMTGLQMLAEMRVREFDIPVIILTSYSDKNNLLTALRLGAIDFLEKPFDYKKMVQVVRDTLDLGMAYRRADEEIEELYRSSNLSEETRKKIREIRASGRFIRKTMQIGPKV